MPRQHVDRIVLRDVVRRLGGGRVVLAGVSAEFAPGELCWLTGTNGSGKSTVVRIAAGVDRPDAGSVVRPRGGVFVLPERVPLLGGVRGEGLLAALAGALGVAREPARRRLVDNLQRLRFSGDGTGRLGTLSKGNLQKLYLAVGFALLPAPLLLDEPLTGLDAAGAEAFGDLVAEAVEDGRVVVVTGPQPGPGGRVLHLAAGRLRPGPARPEEAGLARICLGRDGVDPPPVEWVRPAWSAEVSTDGHLHLAVPASEVTPALAAVLAAGLAVRHLRTPGTGQDSC